MIITCNKCSTRFNLDDFLINQDGSKVRCSVCKHIFTAYPVPLEPEQVPAETSGLSLESDMDDSSISLSSDLEMEDSDLSLEDSDLDIKASDLEIEDTGLELETPTDLEDDDDFSFEADEFKMDEDDASQDLELEESSLEFEDDGIDFDEDGIEFDETPEQDLDGIEFEPLEDEQDAFDITDGESSLEMDYETDFPDIDSRKEDHSRQDETVEDEEEFELEFDVEDDSGIELPGIDEEPEAPSLGIDIDTDREAPSFSPEEDRAKEESPVIPPEEDFSEYDDVLEQETEPEEDLPEEETIEIEDIQEEEKPVIGKPEPLMEMAPPVRRRKKKPLVGTPVLILLLIVLLIFGAYIASIMTGYKIPYLSEVKIPLIEQYLKQPAPEISEAKPIPNQKSVNGRFVTNATAGTLFVITGRVENPSSISYSHIEIRGALITKGKVESKTKNAFCGNIITEEMLKNGNISDINNLIAVKEGNHNSNVNIRPGASVPFMVVFSDLPEKLQNFTVKVTGFEKAGTN